MVQICEGVYIAGLILLILNCKIKKASKEEEWMINDYPLLILNLKIN